MSWLCASKAFHANMIETLHILIKKFHCLCQDPNQTKTWEKETEE